MTDLCHLIYWEKSPADSRREHASSVNTIMVPKKHAMTVARKLANNADLCGYIPRTPRGEGWQPAGGDVVIVYPGGRHRTVWP
jgi:hypothetical protein